MVKSIGIRREDKNNWERRVPLVPEHVRSLLSRHAIAVVIQPSSQRVYRDHEFAQVGAVVNEDLGSCSLILNVKEVPPEKILREKIYVLFSHTIKGQRYNMPMLRRFLEQRCTVIDYERITDDEGKRLVFFGRYAGMAGMIETLRALGLRWQKRGFHTPLQSIRPAYDYSSRFEAQEHLQQIGQQLARQGLPAELSPLVIGITGYGQVSSGAQEMLQGLPVVELAPAQLVTRAALRNDVIYKVVFSEQDMVLPQDDQAAFSLPDYYSRPQNYRSRFADYLSHLTVLVNGIYWDDRYPRFVTINSLREQAQSARPKLEVIGDISCDIGGAVECTERTTTPDEPYYTYDPLTGKTQDGVQEDGIVVLAVDNLPTELPRDASESFSSALWPLISETVNSDFTVPLSDLALPAALKRAIIVYQGQLTPSYSYLDAYVL
jgi:saccharopine dehydrogenase (NAD+, L-lysine forming)